MLVRFVVRLQAGLEHWHALSPVFRFRLVLCLIAGGLAAWVIFDADRPWTAVGAFVADRWLATKCKRDWVQILPGLALVLSYGAFSQPFRSWFCTHPVEPVKEAVLAIRGTLDPNDPKHSDRLTGVLLAWTTITTRTPN